MMEKSGNMNSELYYDLNDYYIEMEQAREMTIKQLIKNMKMLVDIDDNLTMDSPVVISSDCQEVNSISEGMEGALFLSPEYSLQVGQNAITE